MCIRDRHLKIARATRDIIHDNWREGNGRPSVQNRVYEWRQKHPEGRKADCQMCIRDRLQAAEKVRVDLDAIQPEKTLTGAVKGVTVEQVKELKAAAIRGCLLYTSRCV